MPLAESLAILRERDRPRYLAALFAPAMLRDDLLTLYAVAAEIERVPDLVREPALGEIRLQWWADGLARLAGDAAGEGEDRSAPTPLLAALAGLAARRRLPVAPLVALADARRRDLYADPPADEGDLEGILGETDSALFQLACLVAGAAGPESATASGHAGVAYGLSRRLARFGHDLRRGRLILPRTVLERCGLTQDAVFREAPAGRLAPNLAAALADAAALARRHLEAAEEAIAALPKTLRVMFLPLAAVRPTLARVERSEAAILNRPAAPSDLGLLVAIAWRRLRSLTPR